MTGVGTVCGYCSIRATYLNIVPTKSVSQGCPHIQGKPILHIKTMKEYPNYYAIIPANVRYDEDLKPNEKLMYGEISSLSTATGECWATNKYFANLYNVSVRTISEWVNHLKDKGYIQVEMIHNDTTKDIKKRVLRIVKSERGGIEENFYRYRKKLPQGYRKKLPEGIEENFQENNTRNNNTSNNIYADVPEEIKDVFMDWVNMRKKMKKPITSKRAVTMALNTLNKLSTDPKEQRELIEYAIYRSWLSFYPKKEEKQRKMYKEFEKEEKIDAVPMPDAIRKKIQEIF